MVNRKLKQLENKQFIIVCDSENCKHEFLKKSLKIRTDKKEVQGNTLTRRYFCCPKCGREYTIDVTDYKIRQLIKQFKQLVSKHKKMMSQKESPIKLQNHIDKMNKYSEIIYELQGELKGLWDCAEQ